MSKRDPIVVQVLSQGPHVLQLEARALIEAFPALKEHYQLEDSDRNRQFGQFWYSLRKHRIAPSKQPLSLNHDDPIMVQILSKGAHIFQLTATALIDSFPTLKDQYILEQMHNMQQFASFWCRLRQRELEKRKGRCR